MLKFFTVSEDPKGTSELKKFLETRVRDFLS